MRGSFIPPRPIRELHDLTRRRAHLQQDRNRVINRIGRLLETANVKLGSVASNIVGASGRAMLNAMACGGTDAERMSELALGRLQHKKAELVLALNGRYTEHFRWLLKRLLDELEWLDRQVSEVEPLLRDMMHSYLPLIRRLCTIPGVDLITAWTLIAEIGVDMQPFPDADHLASWAGLCPGNSESAGKRQSGRTRKGNRYLRRTLIQNAWAVIRMQDCYLAAVFYRIAARRGMKRAAMAVAHKILTIAYYVLRDGVECRDPGGDYFDRRDPERVAKRLARRLEPHRLPGRAETSGRCRWPTYPDLAGGRKQLPEMRPLGRAVLPCQEPETSEAARAIRLTISELFTLRFRRNAWMERRDFSPT